MKSSPPSLKDLLVTLTDMKIETRKGLWVASSFTEKFGNEDITPASTVTAFKKLERDMTDSEIKEEFTVGESSLEDVAAFLTNPPEGCDDGCWNIFYVAGCVVYVHWRSDNREWFVSTWGLGDGHWDAGLRAFGCNSPSESLESSRANLDSLALGELAKRVESLEERLDALSQWAKSVSSFK